MNERLPDQLDDAIKGKAWIKFKEASDHVDPLEVYKIMPMLMPMTHLHSVAGKHDLLGNI